MSMLRIAVVKRASLVDVLRGLGRAATEELQAIDGRWEGGLDRDSVAVGYFQGNVDMLPSLLVIPGSNRREFFAWVNTYCPFVTPLSQWCRVLTEDEMREFEAFTVFPDYGDVASAWAGAVIGEALLHLGTLDGSSRLTVAGLQSCSSFVAARGFGLWGSNGGRSKAVGQYASARGILGARRDPDALKWDQLWAVLEGLSSTDAWSGAEISEYTDLTIQSCREIQETGFVREGTIARVLHMLEWSLKFIEFEKLGAEQRVELFDRAVESLMRSSNRVAPSRVAALGYASLAEFAVSYFAARIGGGASGHIFLIEKLMANYPSVALWYGMTSGLYRSGIWGAEFQGVGRLALKELRFPLRLDEAPRCDIAFDELAAIVEPGADYEGLGFRGGNLRGLNIEVALGVNGMVRVSNAEEGESEEIDRQAMQFEVGELHRCLRAVSESAYRLEEMSLMRRGARKSEYSAKGGNRPGPRKRKAAKGNEQRRLPIDEEEPER